jgi:hypothetical protein
MFSFIFSFFHSPVLQNYILEELRNAGPRILVGDMQFATVGKKNWKSNLIRANAFAIE